MLIRKDAIHPPPIEAEDELLNLVKKMVYDTLDKSQKFLKELFSLVKSSFKLLQKHAYKQIRTLDFVQTYKLFEKSLTKNFFFWKGNKF